MFGAVTDGWYKHDPVGCTAQEKLLTGHHGIVTQTYSTYGMEWQKEEKKVLCGVLERNEDRKSQSNQKRTYELHGLST